MYKCNIRKRIQLLFYLIFSINLCYAGTNPYSGDDSDRIPESYSQTWEAPSVSEETEEEKQSLDSAEEDTGESRLPEDSFVVSSDVDISGLMVIAEKLEDFPGIRRAVSNFLTSIISLVSRDSRGSALLQAIQQPVMDSLNQITETVDNFLSILGPLTPSIMSSSDGSFPEPFDRDSLSEEEEAHYLNTLESLQSPQQVVDFLNGEVDGDKTEYVLSASRVLFGDPVQLFFDREAVCTGYSRFAQEALENMPEGMEPYETTLIVETYDDLPIPHIMLAYREPENGRWGFLSPWSDHSPQMIEEAGIAPDSPEAIVEYISSQLGGRERITFATDNTFRIFDESYTINEDGTFQKENFLERALSGFSL